jgi:HEAT repeat protein
MTPNELLESMRTDSKGVAARLRAMVDGSVIMAALHLAEDEWARVVLCDALGFRHQAGAVDVLIDRLEDESSRVRSAAADALAKIGDVRAGPALLRRFEMPDPSIGVRRMLLIAVGAVGYRDAIPTLITWLQNPDPDQRGSAAWSLGALVAPEALAPLEAALKAERIRYPRDRMREAISAINRAAAT